MTDPETGRSAAAVVREKKKRDKVRKRMERELAKSRKMIHAERSRNYRLRLKLRGDHNLQGPAQSTDTSSSVLSPFTSRSAEYRARRRVRQALPTTPIKKAHLVEKLMDSPKMSKILSNKGRILNKTMVRRLKMGEVVLESLKNCIDETKSKGTRTHDKFVSYKSLSQVVASNLSAHYGVRRSLTKACGFRKPPKKVQDWWKSPSRKRRTDSLLQNVKDDIAAFFLSGEISRENPGKKYVLEVNGCKVQRHTMTMTLGDAFKAFKEKFPNHQVGFTLFHNPFK